MAAVNTSPTGDLRDLFGADLTPDQVASKAASYRMATDNVPSTSNGQVTVDLTTRRLVKTERATGRDLLTKAVGDTAGVSGDTMAAIEAAVASQLGSDWLQKDITPTSPVPGGLVAFDLEAPAKILAPILTPWRNKFPRNKGMGTAHRYKRITGISGSGTGGVGALNPGFADNSTVNFGNPTNGSNGPFFNRPQKINFAGDDTVLLYVQMGLSSQQSFFTYFSSVGYQDTRSLDRQSTLYASMLAEERVLLYGRGTQTGYSGVLSAPSGTPTGAARTAATGETGVSGVTTNVYVKIVAELGDFGVSQASSASAGIATTNGQVVDVTIPNPVTGATGHKIFVGTGASLPADTAMYLYTGPAYPNNLSAGRTATLTLTVQGALPTTGATVANYGGINLASADGGTGNAQNYDGVIPWIYTAAAAGTGYVGRLNAPFSTASPGAEFQAAFAATYAATKADPEEIWMAGQDRNQISNALKGQSSSNYRLTLSEDQLRGVMLGSVVTSIVNQTTGRTLDINVHPWLPQGNAVILQTSITVPGVNVPNCWSLFNVQDYMAIDWPVTQASYDTSVWWSGLMAAYAPDRSSLITGIQPAN